MLSQGEIACDSRGKVVRGAFVGFLVMLAIGAGGSGVARMTVLQHVHSTGDAVVGAEPSIPPQPLTLDLTPR
jgi:hypothetical protein